MKKIETKNYKNPALALRKRHKERRIKRKLLAIIPMLVLASVIILNSFSPKANVKKDNTTIKETNREYEENGVHFGITEEEWKYHLYKLSKDN